MSIAKICSKNGVREGAGIPGAPAGNSYSEHEVIAMNHKGQEAPIYLDHNATTPLAPEAMEAMMPYLREEFGNPSSGYSLGRRAREGVERARVEVAELICCRPEEIVFTSGGSESNNTVLKGVMDLREPGRTHIVTSAVEHPAILNPALFLMELGARVTVLPVDRHGLVDPDDVRRAVSSETTLISLMLANNETGTLQPIREVSQIAREHNVLFHTDAAQAVGKIEVDVGRLGVDFLSVAGHKLYGPKGVGALFIRRGRTLTPLVHGAAQESGTRAGTENVALSVGLGAACRVSKERLGQDFRRISRLRDRLYEILFQGIEGLVLNGHPEKRLPNTLNVSVPGLEGGKILDALPGIYASTGAACHDRTVKLSHVLSAMGVSQEVGIGALRLTLGRSSTVEQMDKAASMIVEIVNSMRRE